MSELISSHSRYWAYLTEIRLVGVINFTDLDEKGLIVDVSTV